MSENLTAPTSAATAQYTHVAIILHWLMAFLIVVMIIVGLIMGEDEIIPASLRFTVYQIHKSVGLTVLVLTFFRIYWRLSHPVPPLPDTMKPHEKMLAHAAHIGLYLLMLGLPLTGWALVSASPRNIPTMWFGLFEWPHLPILPDVENKKEVSHMFGEVHEVLANGAIALILLHVAAALKHQLVDKDDILARMAPWVKKHE
ncbi:MAG: cytochrome b [Pseudobdellovibrionaceae bacterium]